MRGRAYLSALPAILKKQSEEELWRVYMANGMKMLTENTARFAGGSYLGTDFAEMIRPRKTDSREAEEIVKDVLQGAGITVTQGKESN